MKLIASLFIPLILYLSACKNKNITTTVSSTSLDYRIADSLYSLGNDSSFFYYNRVATTSTDSLQKAGAYNRMALLLFNSGDHFGCQEKVTESLRLLDETKIQHHPYLLPNYNLLGRSYFEQENFDAAIAYFSQAGKFLKKGQTNITLLNNIAAAYQKKKEYVKAIHIFQPIADTCGDTLTFARILSNLARTKWLQNPAYNAAPEFLTALKLRELKNDSNALTTSYSHLADYYAIINPDSSLLFATQMFSVAQNPKDKLDALKKLINIAPAGEVKEHFRLFTEINDSLQQAYTKSRNQFAAIRFETEKSKADNLRLQGDNLKQKVIIYSGILAFIVSLVLLINMYQKRKKKIERESNSRIRENELNTSKKVHDVVANGLYRIMTKLEHTESVDKAPLLDDIESLYEQSRDISYERTQHVAGDYSGKIHQLLYGFERPDTKLLIVGNQETAWKRVPTHIRKELECILQELMVNMIKHSKAKNVVTRFATEEDQLLIHYKDDGIGLGPFIQLGNGLKNTETRIKNLGGTITFDGKTGLKVEISIPIAYIND